MSHHHESFASHGGLDRRLWASAALNAAITLAEFVAASCRAAWPCSRTGPQSERRRRHCLALMARRLGRRPRLLDTPTAQARRGRGSAGHAVTLIAVTVLIAHQAVLRLLHPETGRRGSCWWFALGALGAKRRLGPTAATA